MTQGHIRILGCLPTEANEMSDIYYIVAELIPIPIQLCKTMDHLIQRCYSWKETHQNKTYFHAFKDDKMGDPEIFLSFRAIEYLLD